ncbi:MAG TPA: hypothetical protein VLC09_21005 [Polyangiaceae bacterium]|nr:hypothetical protein [Polyangiaceae bacterium]
MRSTSLALLVSFFSVACGGTIEGADGATNDQGSSDEPGGSDLPASGTGGASASPGPTDPEQTSGVVMRYGDLPALDFDDGGSDGTSDGSSSGPDPESLYLVLGNTSLTCAAPRSTYACGTWSVTLIVPPELAAPGVVSLGDPRVISSMSAQGEDRGGGDCSAGGGSFSDGTLEIVSMNEQEVTVRFFDTWTYDFDINRVYTLPRCP